MIRWFRREIYFELYDDMVIAIGIVCEHRAQ